MIITKREAIQSLDPTLAFSLAADGTLTLAEIVGAENTGTLPTDAEIDAEVIRLQAEYDGNAYQRTRADAYPELKEQFDLLYHDMVADKGDKTGTWFAAVKAVKDATPKP